MSKHEGKKNLFLINVPQAGFGVNVFKWYVLWEGWCSIYIWVFELKGKQQWKCSCCLYEQVNNLSARPSSPNLNKLLTSLSDTTLMEKAMLINDWLCGQTFTKEGCKCLERGWSIKTKLKKKISLIEYSTDWSRNTSRCCLSLPEPEQSFTPLPET